MSSDIGFWAGALQNTLGGVAVGGLAFMLARVPSLSGVWTVRTKCAESSYNPYIGLELTYIVMISQRGADMTGIAEKVFERRSDGSEHEHVGKGRKRSEITGGLSGLAIQRKRFELLFREGGELRDYATVHTLRKHHRDCYKGKFVTTAANSSGTSVWTKGIGNYSFKLLACSD